MGVRVRSRMVQRVKGSKAQGRSSSGLVRKVGEEIMVSDNQLWLYFLRNTSFSLQDPNCLRESAVFAENHLRSGYPLSKKAVLFDMNVPAVRAINQVTLTLFAARRTSGIVVNIGFHATSVVPVFQGKVMREVGVEVVGQRALKLTSFLKELILQNLCYVAADYEAEMSKDTQSSFEVPGEGWFSLSSERFQTAEKNVHLRLEKELLALLPPSMSKGLRVIPPPYGTESAWFGGKILSNESD
ncbi:hypothetical protein Syun_010595 [Stephania yunnanensis]|uniref:Actin-related protein 8 n=1 Tax=Stephania yunnanensis TaxID=152371 RepID=A0AAP0KGR9_9MAGN